MRKAPTGLVKCKLAAKACCPTFFPPLFHVKDTRAARPEQGDGEQEILVPIAAGPHLFPFRTESLSPPAPMVLKLLLRESRSVPIQYFCAPRPHGPGRFFFARTTKKESLNPIAARDSNPNK